MYEVVVAVSKILIAEEMLSSGSLDGLLPPNSKIGDTVEAQYYEFDSNLRGLEEVIDYFKDKDDDAYAVLAIDESTDKAEYYGNCDKYEIYPLTSIYVPVDR